MPNHFFKFAERTNAYRSGVYADLPGCAVFTYLGSTPESDRLLVGYAIPTDATADGLLLHEARLAREFAKLGFKVAT